MRFLTATSLLILRGCLVFAATKEPPTPFESTSTSGPAAALPAPLSPEESEKTLLHPYFHRWTKERQEKWLKLSEDKRKQWLTERGHKWAALQEEYRARDRKELVRPAPPGFKPDKAKRKLKLTLVARDKTIRKGEAFWFRLELQNIGSEPFLFQEYSSYFKDGYASRDHLPFYAIQPDGRKEELHYSMGGGASILTGEFSLPGWEGMTDAEKRKAIEKWRMEGKFKTRLFINLEPGESVVTMPWRRWSKPEREAWVEKGVEPPPVPGQFRELRTRYKFEQLGRYHIQAVYSEWPYGPPKPPTEKEIKDSAQHNLAKKGLSLMEEYEAYIQKYMPPLESNTVSVDVAP